MEEKETANKALPLAALLRERVERGPVWGSLSLSLLLSVCVCVLSKKKSREGSEAFYFELKPAAILQLAAFFLSLSQN